MPVPTSSCASSSEKWLQLFLSRSYVAALNRGFKSSRNSSSISSDTSVSLHTGHQVQRMRWLAHIDSTVTLMRMPSRLEFYWLHEKQLKQQTAICRAPICQAQTRTREALQLARLFAPNLSHRVGDQRRTRD